MATRFEITIVADVPDDAGHGTLSSWVCDALDSYGGSLHPEHPLFKGINIKSVKTRVPRELQEQPISGKGLSNESIQQK
jgi:hypothetical protein